MNTRPRVLVIDDDPLFRNLMTTILGKDFHVVVAAEGSEGFHVAIETPPDIAIIDLQMPGWDGMRTLKAMRSHPTLSQVKFVIMTSIATRKMVLEAIQGGANDYIVKTSFRREEFMMKLLRLLPEHRRHSADVAQPHFAHGNAHSPDVPIAVKTPARRTAPKPAAAPAAELVTSSTAAPGSPSSTDANLRAIIDHWE